MISRDTNFDLYSEKFLWCTKATWDKARYYIARYTKKRIKTLWHVRGYDRDFMLLGYKMLKGLIHIYTNYSEYSACVDKLATFGPHCTWSCSLRLQSPASMSPKGDGVEQLFGRNAALSSSNFFAQPEGVVGLERGWAPPTSNWVLSLAWQCEYESEDTMT